MDIHAVVLAWDRGSTSDIPEYNSHSSFQEPKNLPPGRKFSNSLLKADHEFFSLPVPYKLVFSLIALARVRSEAMHGIYSTPNHM